MALLLFQVLEKYTGYSVISGPPMPKVKYSLSPVRKQKSITMRTAPIHYIKSFVFLFREKGEKNIVLVCVGFFLSLHIFIYTRHCDN